MKRFKNFVYTVFIGGITVILPVAILGLFFGFVVKIATGLLEPFTRLLEGSFNIHTPLTDVIVVVLLMSLAFLVGLLVRTRFGKLLYELIEKKFLEATPGYKIIRETTAQLMSKKSPLSRVAIIKPFDSETRMTAFITNEHADGSYTVFLPMAPPTSGFVFHLKASQVEPVEVSTQDAMKIFISLGAGSDTIIDKFQENVKRQRS
jgi:uncharacterized membrane protein